MSDTDMILRLMDRTEVLENELHDLASRLEEIEQATRRVDRFPTDGDLKHAQERVECIIKSELEGRRVLIQRAKAGDAKASLILATHYNLKLVKAKTTRPPEVLGAADTLSHRVSDTLSNTLSHRVGEQRAESREPEEESREQGAETRQ